MKTSELTGRALDWAVAKCEKQDIRDIGKFGVQVAIGNEYDLYASSKYWAQGGPIIERELMTLQFIPDDMYDDNKWEAQMWDAFGEELGTELGSTPLIAAMRCYVASKLGEEIEIPEELK